MSILTWLLFSSSDVFFELQLDVASDSDFIFYIVSTLKKDFDLHLKVGFDFGLNCDVDFYVNCTSDVDFISPEISIRLWIRVGILTGISIWFRLSILNTNSKFEFDFNFDEDLNFAVDFDFHLKMDVDLGLNLKLDFD